MHKKAVEWLDEAAKIAANQQCEYGSEEGKGDGTSFSLTGHNAALWARATIPERRAVVMAFASNTVVADVAMVNAYINDELGTTWGSVLTRNKTIVKLNLESNSITSGGMSAIAAALRVNSTLVELKVSNQHLAFSQQSEMEIAEALESNVTLMKLTIELRSSTARERMNKYLQRNQDQLRQRRRATNAAGGGAAPTNTRGSVAAQSLRTKQTDWAGEAARIGASRPPQYGGGELRTEGLSSAYEMSGHNAALWGRATEAERHACVEAFASNTVVTHVHFVNAYINDELGKVWASVLCRNRTITSLNLESNSITTGGMLAIAAALRVNSTLVELKLHNQGIAMSSQSEVEIAEALEGNSTLTKLTIELRNPRPRELMNKYLQRNQDKLRQRRRATNAAGGGGGAAQPRAVAGFAAVSDWAAEAERIGASQPAQYGDRLVADKEGAAYSYITTGNALWSRATGYRLLPPRTACVWSLAPAPPTSAPPPQPPQPPTLATLAVRAAEERRVAVAAFATNTCLTNIEMVNAFVSAESDGLAQVWAQVLATNSTITSLNLESNSIGSAGLEALATVLRTNRSLRELKLANQHTTHTQAVEETMAHALETNGTPHASAHATRFPPLAPVPYPSPPPHPYPYQGGHAHLRDGRLQERLLDHRLHLEG